jgi:hypothetical protein
MAAFPIIVVLACAAAAQAGDAGSKTIASYKAVMHEQYAAHSAPTTQRADEAKRVYDAYLKSIGEKPKDLSDDSSGSAGDSSR